MSFDEYGGIVRFATREGVALNYKTFYTITFKKFAENARRKIVVNRFPN